MGLGCMAKAARLTDIDCRLFRDDLRAERIELAHVELEFLHFILVVGHALLLDLTVFAPAVELVVALALTFAAF